MNRMIKKIMVVLLSAFMFMGAVTIPVQAKGVIGLSRTIRNLTEENEPVGFETEMAEKEQQETAAEDQAPAAQPAEIAEESAETESDVLLNVEDFYQEYIVGDLGVTVSYAAETLPEGTEVIVTEGKPEALEAIKAENGDDFNYASADISFIYNGEEVEPKDYSDNQVSITLTYVGEEDLSDAEFGTLHAKESIDEEGNVIYDVETVDAVMTDEKAVVSVPYEYTWTETVVKYKDVDIYEDVQVPVEVEKEVPVYETREITEERTTYVTKTRQVEKTRTVKVPVAFKWYDPSTWLGYKYVTETYYETETYEEPVTETVVIGTEEVQVGTETVVEIEYVTEQRYVRTDTVEDGTEEVEHTETRYRDEEVVVGQTVAFDADDFSTFTVIWGTDNTVTIHHGIMQSGQFVEFGTNGLPSSSNTNYPTSLNRQNYNDNDYAVLIYDFPGYSYSATYYRTSTSSTPTTGSTAIWPALRRVNATGTANDNWRYSNATRTTWNNDGAAANNSHIYVIYTPKTITDGFTPSSEGDDPGTPTLPAFTPDVGKNVTDQKSDGTYDITLGFVGNKDTNEVKTTARVIVVFDLSGSMEGDISGDMPTTTYWNGWRWVTEDNPDFDGTSRLTLAKNAVNALADKLLAIEDKQGNKLVEMGLVTFATDGRIRTFGTGTAASNFTSDYTAYSNVITNLPVSTDDTLGTGVNAIGRGTNWEKGLDLANSMAASTAGKTYIVFVSDGDPTYRVSRGSYSDSDIVSEMTFDRVTIPIFGSGSSNYDRNFNTAREVAKSIVEHKKAFYAVGLSSDATRMTNLATYSGGTYKAGNNAEEFANSLSDIAGAISSEIGLSDVTITDGVTDMSQIETQSLIGTAGNFTYNKSYPLVHGDSGYTYTIGETTYSITQAQFDAKTDGTHRIFSRQLPDNSTAYYIEYPWEGDNVPEAEINASNAVVWDTSEANNELEHGVYYSVTFTVWPKQEAYDLIADLDNGIVKVTDEDLEATTKTQLRVLINNVTYEYFIGVPNNYWTSGSGDSLTDSEMQALIDANDASFSMKTNTGLSASYKYGGTPSTANYTNYTNGNMTLDDTAINIKKTWNNYMDAREASDVTLTITRTDEEGTTENYFDIAMGEPVEVTTPDDGKQWVQEPDHDLYISLGVMSVNGDDITIREKGYDYTVVEPENFSYRWDLSADIYHPMVINGITTVLIEVQDKTTVPAAAQALEQNKVLADAEDGNTYYAFEGNLYVVKTGENSLLLEATNDRRSNLILNKVVEDQTAPEDDLFPFEITVTNPNAPLPTEAGYNTWYHTSWFFISTEANDRSTMIIDEIEVSENVTAEVSELRVGDPHITDIVTHEGDDEHPYPYITYNYDGSANLVKAVNLEQHSGEETVDGETVTYTYYSYYTGFYWFDNGATATVNIKDGWYINFNNMGRETTYTVVEPIADLPAGYTFDSAETLASNMQNEQVTPGSVEENTVTGTIDKPNSDYFVTYNNNFEGFFYVYHSSDNTVDRFAMANNGVVVTDFDIAGLTNEATLYGGYFTDYAGKSTAFDVDQLVFTDNKATDNGDDAKKYDYQYIKDSLLAAWQTPYTANGLHMTPVSGTVYYLKEVPVGYLQPYLHYTYYKATGNICSAWLISDVDDNNYTETGFIIVDENNQATVCKSLTVQTTHGGNSVKLTPKRVFSSKGVLDGYLTYTKVLERGSDALELLAERNVVQQYWITPDNLFVTGTTTRSYKGLDNISGVGVDTETAVKSVITDLN